MPLTLGDFTLWSLSDGQFRLDGGAMFGVVPKPLWQRRAPADDLNRISLGLRPLLVKTASELVLVDAGVGDKMTAREADIYGFDRGRHLDHALARAGVTAQDITVVVTTHLHFDHVGGCTMLADGVLMPRFPHARYIVRQQEFDDATHPHERNRASYLTENFMPLAAAGLVDFVDRDGEVLPGISVWRTGGHTRHHQLVRIESAGEVAVFVADLMPTTAHIDPAWIMGYDLYPMDTLAYKKEFLREAVPRRYVIFFEHDPVVPAGIIRQDGKRFLVDPVDV